MNQAEGKDRAQLERKGRWLLVRFQEPHLVLSWAVVRGGKTQTKTVAWYRVIKEELKPPVNPREFLKARLAEESIPKAVGLLTSANLDLYGDDERTEEGITVRSIATVGLANALRVGDPPRVAEAVGTINLLCQVSRPLSKEAFLEALALAAEARAAVLLESGVLSTESGLPATGTGTDCIVIAAPRPSKPTASRTEECRAERRGASRRGERLNYVGKHTPAGHLIGASVMQAVRAGFSR